MPNIKNATPSNKVNCPVCDNLVNSRGLHAHLRLAHPNSNALEVTRSVLVPRGKRKRIFIVESEDINNESKLLIRCKVKDPSEFVFIKAEIEYWLMNYQNELYSKKK
jgi:hypothetical protein